MKKLIFSVSTTADDLADDIEAFFATKDKMLTKPHTYANTTE